MCDVVKGASRKSESYCAGQRPILAFPDCYPANRSAISGNPISNDVGMKIGYLLMNYVIGDGWRRGLVGGPGASVPPIRY